MLDPNRRSMLTSLLVPPPGMVFDAGLATTYSLDPLVLLGVPLHLAWLAAEADGTQLNDPLRVFEALQRIGERMVVYADRGRMHVPAQAHALYGLLEQSIVEVRAPHGGAFHPKLWVLRFVQPGDEEDVVLRLGVLTRNLTTDRSWDLSLQLEGRPTGQYVGANRELGELLAALPSLAVESVDPGRAEWTALLADELRRTRWELPGDWEEVAFHVLGRTKRKWTPPASDELVVLSPFVRADALTALRQTTKRAVALIARPEELIALDPSAREAFGQCLVLAEAAETEDGEEAVRHDAVGLHAKALLLRAGWYTHLLVGSANATDAAILRGTNIEVMAELVGKRSRVGVPEDLLAREDLGGMLVPFDAATPLAAPDAERVAAEKALDAARSRLAEAKLSVTCTRDGDEAWRLVLSGVPQDLGVEAAAWPLSVREELAVELVPSTDLGVLATADVTGLIGFALSYRGIAQRFALNTVLVGRPPDRDAAVLRRLIRNREGFYRYLRLLLGGVALSTDAGGEDGGAGGGAWRGSSGAGLDTLLEDLVRAFARDRERLADVRRLVERLRSAEDGEEIIPPEFLELWTVFESALEAHP